MISISPSYQEHTPTENGYDRVIWLSSRTDGRLGIGTPNNPVDVSTQEKFDGLLRNLYISGKSNITFYFSPGVYKTKGANGNWGFDNWACLSGWRFLGSGKENTIIKLSSFRYINQLDRDAAGAVVFAQSPWGRRGVEISNLTIDGGWTDFGSTINQDFTIPGDLQTVQISVQSSSNFVSLIGKNLYLQRIDNKSVVGVFELVSVDGPTSITIRNLATEFPGNLTGLILSGVVVVPRMNTGGISLGSTECKVERVRVTNVGCPIYEGALGINMTAINGEHAVKPAKGNIIRDCIIDNLWGTFGWILQLKSNNADTGDNGTSIEGLVENNVIVGNGHNQGLGGFGMSNTVWRGNTVKNCAMGLFIDTGYNRDVLVENNFFIGCTLHSIHIGGGYLNGLQRFTFRGNKILLPTQGRAFVFNGGVTESSIIGNEIYLQASPTGCRGIMCYQASGASLNVARGNRIPSQISNFIEGSSCILSDNYNETGVSV